MAAPFCIYDYLEFSILLVVLLFLLFCFKDLALSIHDTGLHQIQKKALKPVSGVGGGCVN